MRCSALARIGLIAVTLCLAAAGMRCCRWLCLLPSCSPSPSFSKVTWDTPVLVQKNRAQQKVPPLLGPLVH
jgi:hypothetical protein